LKEVCVCFFSFFLGGNSPTFKLENMISTYTNDVSWKKSLKFARFQRIFFFQIVRFFDKLQYVAKNIERFYLFFYFHILCVAKSG